MSGHSKWSTIKHKKGAADAKRGQIFTKIIKELTIAARMGGGDVDTNPRLRSVLLKAKGANMPKDNIERAIKKGTGELGDVIYTELAYEGYASNGVGLLIEALTDNKNRTSAEIKNLLSKNGGSLAAQGAVSYQFKRKGVMVFDRSKIEDFDSFFEVALENGAEDVSDEAEISEVMTEPADFEAVLDALNAAGYEQESAELSMVPDSRITLDNEATQKVLNLIDKIEENEDVQSVASNLEISDDFE